MKNVIEFVHDIIRLKVDSNDICVDNTIGNGNDTLFLASISKFVYGFDIQQIALDNTEKLLNENNKTNYKLFLKSHDLIDDCIDIEILKEVKCFIYNLGYLPKGDKTITTNYQTTLNSLKKCVCYLNHHSLIFLTCYIGHKQGKIESDKLLEYTKNLDHNEYEVTTYNVINQDNNPPFVIIIERR